MNSCEVHGWENDLSDADCPWCVLQHLVHEAGALPAFIKQDRRRRGIIWHLPRGFYTAYSDAVSYLEKRRAEVQGETE